MDTQGFKIDAVVICDDIRSEVSGKAILIGVYAGDIVLSRTPATIHIALWLAGRVDPGVADQLKVNIHVGDNPEVSAETSIQPASMRQAENGEFYVAINGIVLNISEPTTITVRVKKNQDDWVPVTRKKILLAEPDTPPSTERPRLS